MEYVVTVKCTTEIEEVPVAATFVVHLETFEEVEKFYFDIHTGPTYQNIEFIIRTE